jgi:hypothetical protein
MSRRFVLGILIWMIPFVIFTSDLTLLKNANVYLSSGSIQENSFILIHGAKISRIGLMSQLGKNVFPDVEFDLEDHFVYPAFIDSFYQGLQKKDSRSKEKKSRSQEMPVVDKTVRKSFKDRKLLIARRGIDIIELEKSKLKKVISHGFGFLHIIPEDGIIGGSSCLLSTLSPTFSESVLIPEVFMTLNFATNSSEYPTTLSSLLVELKQLKEDSFYHQMMKGKHIYHSTCRLKYIPELDIIYPYFLNKKRFVIKTKNRVEQRIFELVQKDMKLNPVLVGCSEIWRREVKPRTDIILPLTFNPPLASRYSKMGDAEKKKAKDMIFPKKIAQFFSNYPRISLTAPTNGDYKTLLKNIRILLKNGVKEKKILDSLTTIPAALLGIQNQSGRIAKGYLASLIVADKKIFSEKSKIVKMFIEGKFYDFKPKGGKGKPPAADLTGNWLLKIEGQMNFEWKMTIQQEGNNFTGQLISSRGSMDFEDGFISGSSITFSTSAPIGGQSTTIEVSGEYKDGKIVGTISIGSFGESSFTASPDQMEI